MLALLLISSAEANLTDGACADASSNGDQFPDKSASGAQFRETVSPDYSLLWDVEYDNTYKTLTNAQSNQNFVLYQCGIDPPANNDVPAGATFISVPITMAATTSTTYIPLIEMIGERRALKAYGSSFDYVSSPCLRKMFREGDVVSAYDPETFSRDDQMIQDLGVEVTFADEFSKDAYASYVMTDTAEVAPNAVLKTAEYVEVVGLFFNREKEATEIIERMISNYLCTRDAVAEALGTRPPVKVMWSSYNAAAGGWSVPSADAWYAELIEAAGGELLLPTDAPAVTDEFGYKYLSTDQAVALARTGNDKEVWISPGPWDPRAAPYDAAPLATVPAVVGGRVFDNQGPNGANDWFERRVVEPDTLLQDIAAALHPNSIFEEDIERKWLRDVYADEPIGGVSDDDLDAACPDVTAPYVFESSPLCERGNSKKKKKSNTSRTIGAAVGLTLAGVAALLLLMYCCSYPRREPGPSFVTAPEKAEQAPGKLRACPDECDKAVDEVVLKSEEVP
jgi:iron complex transport system substrate-binding protein